MSLPPGVLVLHTRAQPVWRGYKRPPPEVSARAEEWQIFGRGHPQAVVFRSPLIDLQDIKNINSIEWLADAPAGTRVEIRTRSGNELAETLGSGPDSADQHLRVARIHLQYGSRAEGLQWLLRSYSVNKQHRPTVEELVSYYQQQSQRYPDVPDYQRTLDNFKNLLVQLGG